MFFDLRIIVGECSATARHLRSLASLFDASLISVDGTKDREGLLVDQGYLLVDIIRTMAGRLDTLEERAVAQIQRHELEAGR